MSYDYDDAPALVEADFFGGYDVDDFSTMEVEPVPAADSGPSLDDALKVFGAAVDTAGKGFSAYLGWRSSELHGDAIDQRSASEQRVIQRGALQSGGVSPLAVGVGLAAAGAVAYFALRKGGRRRR